MIKGHNPDILSCLANLSSDEVFTPPKVAGEMLDLLPATIWSDPNVTFLDPVSKTGVFLREIARRLDAGLKTVMPDRQERINHIFGKQVFGIGITELTALTSRRSVYCSKHANGKYSVCDAFDNEQGNIRFKRIKHSWKKGRCAHCGASKGAYDRGEDMETHAYEFIHTKRNKKVFDMEFDVIIGNPPYHLSDAGESTGSSPIYQHFIQKAISLSPRFLSMIIPARWFAGGKGLEEFRNMMLYDHRISHLVDYPISSDVFPGVKIIGGICYFLWDREHQGECSVTTVMNDDFDKRTRYLDDHDVFVRFNKAVPILDKVLNKHYPALSQRVSTQKPFGLRTFVNTKKSGDVLLYANKEVGWYSKSDIQSGLDMIDQWKVLVSRGYGEGGEARDYPRMILGKPILAAPPSACTETYIVVGSYDTESEAGYLAQYIRTRFFRFLVALRKNTQDVSRDRFSFVPDLPMDKKWTDDILYSHFGITHDEVEFIHSIIRPMESDDE